jgi:hypothetical protein
MATSSYSLMLTGEAANTYIIVFGLARQGAVLDINVCPIPAKTDIGKVDLVSLLSDGTSKKNLWRLFSMIKMCCFVILTDKNFVNNYFNVLKNINFH